MQLAECFLSLTVPHMKARGSLIDGEHASIRGAPALCSLDQLVSNSKACVYRVHSKRFVWRRQPGDADSMCASTCWLYFRLPFTVSARRARRSRSSLVLSAGSSAGSFAICQFHHGTSMCSSGALVPAEATGRFPFNKDRNLRFISLLRSAARY